MELTKELKLNDLRPSNNVGDLLIKVVDKFLEQKSTLNEQMVSNLEKHIEEYGYEGFQLFYKGGNICQDLNQGFNKELKNYDITSGAVLTLVFSVQVKKIIDNARRFC